MSTPSISVVNCGSALSFASALRQSYSVCPVARERLDRRQLHALRPIWDELPGGPASRVDAATQLVQLLVGNLDVKGTDVGGGLDGGAHDYLLLKSLLGFG